VKLAVVEPNADEARVLNWNLIDLSTNPLVDMFSFYKSGLILGAGFLLACFHIYRLSRAWRTDVNRGTITLAGYLRSGAWFKDPIIVALCVFVIAALLSTLTSKYLNTSILGAHQRYEGLPVLIAYVVVFLSTISYASSWEKIKVIFWGTCFSALIIGLIGLSQYLRHDFFLTDFGTRLMFGKLYGVFDSPTAVFGDVAYGTVYNPNTLGMYSAMMLPLTLSVGLAAPLKSWAKYALLCVAALMGVCMIGSNGTGGFFGFCFALIAGGTVFIIYTIKRRKYTNLYFALGFALLALCLALFAPPVRRRIETGVAKLMDTNTSTFLIKDLKLEKGAAEVFYANDGTPSASSLKLELDPEASRIVVRDGAGEVLIPSDITANEESETADVTAVFSLPALGNFRVRTVANYILLELQPYTIYFALDNEQNMYLIDPLTMAAIDISEPAPSIGFEGRELFATGRGYIWSRSLPLINPALILGTGPDTFQLVFPQYDAIGKLKYLGHPYMHVDKAHNLYVQTAVNTGLLSLLAILFIFALYLIRTIKNILTQELDTQTLGLNLGIFSGVCGFLVAALTTDSVVSVSPVFWALLGLGFALLKVTPAADKGQKR
ncbi:MAG: O-antigen ligase family protein, partial [Clostridiales bacterium]|nr:O-antigen ligase family protein [Clostridiales bacterium]